MLDSLGMVPHGLSDSNADKGSFTSDMSQAKSVIAYVFFADGIPIIYAGQEQHYAGGEDPYNREALWLSGYSKDSELYKFISTANKIRKLAISKDPNYLTARVRILGLRLFWTKY